MIIFTGIVVLKFDTLYKGDTNDIIIITIIIIIIIYLTANGLSPGSTGYNACT